MADEAKILISSRVAISTGLTLGIIFIGCWLGTKIDIPASHRFVELFTAYPITSWAAFGQGTIAALFGGWVGGFIWASFYNALPFRRG